MRSIVGFVRYWDRLLALPAVLSPVFDAVSVVRSDVGSGYGACLSQTPRSEGTSKSM